MKKFISAIMCGMYISLGATIYVHVGHSIAGALYFAVGIMLVSSYCNMLSTRVMTLLPFRKEKDPTGEGPSKYNLQWKDLPISLLGNTLGVVVYSFLLSNTRFGNESNLYNLQGVVGARLTDDMLSIFIYSILCGFFVASACLTHRIKDANKLTQLFLSTVFISAFVLTVPEHIVADLYFFSYYSFTIGFEWVFIPILGIVTIGNIIGCMGTGYIQKYMTQ